MPHITLSIPDDVYKLMRKYRDVNWSEVARRAIVKRLLAIKAEREGLTREELVMLCEVTGLTLRPRAYGYEEEVKLQEIIKDRERRRLELLRRIEEK